MRQFPAPKQITIEPVTHYLDQISIEEQPQGGYRVTVNRVPGRNTAGTFVREPIAEQEAYWADGMPLSTPMTPEQLAAAVVAAHQARETAAAKEVEAREAARMAAREAERQREAPMGRPIL